MGVDLLCGTTERADVMSYVVLAMRNLRAPGHRVLVVLARA
jgi:hypothetical protein